MWWIAQLSKISGKISLCATDGAKSRAPLAMIDSSTGPTKKKNLVDRIPTPCVNQSLWAMRAVLYCPRCTEFLSFQYPRKYLGLRLSGAKPCKSDWLSLLRRIENQSSFLERWASIFWWDAHLDQLCFYLLVGCSSWSTLFSLHFPHVIFQVTVLGLWENW